MCPARSPGLNGATLSIGIYERHQTGAEVVKLFSHLSIRPDDVIDDTEFLADLLLVDAVHVLGET